MTRNGTISTISPVMRRIMAALDRDGDMDDGHNQPPLLKKEPINVKLPRWLIEWLDDQPESRAVLIEEALKRRHKLKPPEGA